MTQPARTLTDAELDDLAERLAKRLEGRLAPAAKARPAKPRRTSWDRRRDTVEVSEADLAAADAVAKRFGVRFSKPACSSRDDAAVAASVRVGRISEPPQGSGIYAACLERASGEWGPQWQRGDFYVGLAVGDREKSTRAHLRYAPTRCIVSPCSTHWTAAGEQGDRP